MINPILGVRFPIQLSTLYIDAAISRIEIHVPNSSRFTGHWACYIRRFEIRRCDEVNILTWVGERDPS